MRKLILPLASLLCLAFLPAAFAADARQNGPVIPCDQPGADPGGTRPGEATTAPCNVGTPNDVGNTAVTQPRAPGGDQRLPPKSQTRQLPPPHNPQPNPSGADR